MKHRMSQIRRYAERMDVIQEAELVLEEFNSGNLCRFCLHPRGTHLHGLMACCQLRTVSVNVDDWGGTTIAQELCACEALQ